MGEDVVYPLLIRMDPLLWLLLALIGLVLLILFRYGVIVPADHVGKARNRITQRVRTLHPGPSVVPPWEELLTVSLPIDDDPDTPVYWLQTNGAWLLRCTPPAFEFTLSDGSVAKINVAVRYQVVPDSFGLPNIERATTLQDAVRGVLADAVERITRETASVAVIWRALQRHDWSKAPPILNMAIIGISVQKVTLDPETLRLMRGPKPPPMKRDRE